MSTLNRTADRPGLLVSVRNAEEARIALEAGANVIDVKEPTRGSLGAAEPQVVAEVAAVVRGRVPLSVAVGELVDGGDSEALIADVSLAKLGLAGCGSRRNWREQWRETLESWPVYVKPVAVVYADWRAANAPRPEEALDAAIGVGARVLLVDTCDKSAGDLFDHWPANELTVFCSAVHAAGLTVVLAGSLRASRFAAAVACDPDLVAVRGAVCAGRRTDRISAVLVKRVRESLQREAAAKSDKLLSLDAPRAARQKLAPIGLWNTEFS